MCAMRVVSTRVLPVPAPASTSTGPSSVSTASRCSGLRPSRYRGAAAAARARRDAVGDGPMLVRTRDGAFGGFGHMEFRSDMALRGREAEHS